MKKAILPVRTTIEKNRFVKNNPYRVALSQETYEFLTELARAEHLTGPELNRLVASPAYRQ